MSRGFFDTVADALWGFLPEGSRRFHHQVGFHNLKVWFGSTHEHYEVQRIGRGALKASGKTGATAIEIGFHCEHPKPALNDERIALIVARERAWRRRLGPEAEAGGFLGRPEIRDRWRRLSELWIGEMPDEDGAAIEASERLGTYISVVEPILAQAPGAGCACFREGAGRREEQDP